MNALLALLSAFSAAAYFVYVSFLMKHTKGLASGTVLVVGHLTGALALLPFVPLDRWHMAIGPATAPPLLYAALLLVVSRQLYYYAYARTDVAHITVFSALTPVYALGTGYMLLGEIPTPKSLAGLMLICGGVYAVFLKRQAGVSLMRNIMGPFLTISRSRPVLMAFLSTIPTAFAATFQKQLMAVLDPATFSFGLLLIIGLVSMAIERAQRPVFPQLRLLPWHFYAASAVLMPTMHVLFCLVMQTQPTAISLVLQRSAIVFQIVLAYFLLKEQHDLKKRLAAATVIMAGFGMIMW